LANLVIIPTYNEIENIETVLSSVFALDTPFDVLIVDDGSPDGTAKVVQKLIAEKYTDKLFLQQRTGKLGLGTAYIHGFKWALNAPKNYAHIFEMDADLSHNPADLPRLLHACTQGAAMSIGSRYISGVNVVNWPLLRILLSYGASFYVKIITGMQVQDPTAGFVCYTRAALQSLDLDKIEFIGYAFQIEMKYKIWQQGLKLTEVPIVFTDRTKGQSKMHIGIIKEAVWGVLKLKFF
jgi:dolichol-phosphate mannosyltransferase